ncbi:hypothetical protein E2562_022426 [Oryza meyeriana var. granulata]|uniref:Uncharacterized protein n=1 Tax=Oryza meyeriana var. granulata TaxID=110450 RepID=A0A6G1BLD8_9ORYZ|nr:hypothetical protein E2562_022426 [Oryza meyeriana var. granulata]
MAEFSWNRAGDPKGQPAITRLILRNNAATHFVEAIVCNSFEELELGAFVLAPDVLPFGPLGSGGKPIAVFDFAQLVELAEGLALTSWPFLWVVRPGSVSERWLDRLRRHTARARGVSNSMPFLCWPYFADQFLRHGRILPIVRA